MTKQFNKYVTTRILIILIGVVCVLYFAKPLFVPLAFAAVFTALLMPVFHKLQRWGLNEGLSILVSVLLLVSIFGALGYGIYYQASVFAADRDEIQEQFTKQLHKVENWLSNSLNVEKETVHEQLKSRAKGIAGSLSPASLFTQFVTVIVNTLLVLVYIILMIMMRKHFTKFLRKSLRNQPDLNTNQITNQVNEIVQQYLIGYLLTIAGLFVAYAIGFTITGLKYGIFLAAFAAVLSIIPYVGNIVGGTTALIAAVITGGGSGVIIGVLATMIVAQLFENYIFQPFVVGDRVDLNPLITIVSVVGFGLLWGIPGAVLAIPLTAILKAVFDQLPHLEHLGFLMGKENEG